MNKKAVPVGDLQFGMYISELDRPWTETPFAFQGFWLQTDRQLAALRKFCKHVFIDAAKSQAKGTAPRRSAPEPDLTVPAFEIHGNAGYAPPSDLPREIEAATLVYSRTCEALRITSAETCALAAFATAGFSVKLHPITWWVAPPTNVGVPLLPANAVRTSPTGLPTESVSDPANSSATASALSCVTINDPESPEALKSPPVTEIKSV